MSNGKNRKTSVAERLYPFSKKSQSQAKRNITGVVGNSLTLNKLKQAPLLGDGAEKDHAEWLTYPCSVADLQKSAHVVLESQKQLATSKILDKA